MVRSVKAYPTATEADTRIDPESVSVQIEPVNGQAPVPFGHVHYTPTQTDRHARKNIDAVGY